MNEYRFHLDGQSRTLPLLLDEPPALGRIVDMTCPWFGLLPADLAERYEVTAIDGSEIQCAPVS